MHPRSLPQNRKLCAMVADVQRVYPLVPWKRALACEAWKRFFIALWVREARVEAFMNREPDPFPVRPVPSSSLDSWQMDELIECTYAVAAQKLGLILN